MRIVIAGGHGKIALHLERLLAQRGDIPVGLVRNPDHAEDVRATGAEAELLDLENATVTQVAEKLMGADAAVFAAGAGPGSGADRKETVDRDAAIRMADAAALAGVNRYVVVSAIGVDEGPAPDAEPVWATYVAAKRDADADIRGRELDTGWTILRPGGLTNDAGTGRVWLAPQAERGEVPREDVAAVIVALLDEPATIGHVLDLVGGSTPVADAVASVTG